MDISFRSLDVNWRSEFSVDHYSQNIRSLRKGTERKMRGKVLAHQHHFGVICSYGYQ